MSAAIERLAEKAGGLPSEPGVYIMLDAAGEVIYVGKAKKLKNRVGSYFHGDHLPKVAAMVEKVADFNVIVTNSEFEALVLENSLIKRHLPHYNILLKDDKGYPFIRLDGRGDYPTFSIVSRPEKDGAEYFGPYGGRGLTKEIIDTISKALGLPTCSRKFPRDIGRGRPCLNHHMGTCAGWCLPGMTGEDYRERIAQARLILEGRTVELEEELNRQMEAASAELRFEQAAAVRDRLRAVQGLSNKQRVISTAFSDADAVGFCRDAKSAFVVLHYTGGDLTGKDLEIMPEPMEEDAEALSHLLRQYYVNQNSWPKTILLPMELPDAAELKRLFSEAAGRRVSVEVPKRGERVRLVETAMKNAREESRRVVSAAQRRLKTLERLQKALGLPELPRRIESFDVSNLGDTGIVAAMVVFYDGRPLKRDYRKFKIKDLELRDDYASMRQAVERRFRRMIDGDGKFSDAPDLLLIDGGRTHADAAKGVLTELGLTIPVYGMVKDDRHRTRALMTAEGEEIGISGDQSLFALIGNIQEETHRFAIEFQRSLRREGLSSALDGIEGVGEKRRNDLLKHFKTLKAVKAAEIDELCAVIPKNAAKAVYEHFHSKEKQA